MKKLLFIQAVPRHPSGGSAVASWMLQALKQEWAVTILTWSPYDFGAPDRYYGTSLRPNEFTVRCAPWPLRPLRRFDPDPWSIQPTSYLLRMCKKIGDDYDVIASADDESDFGRPGLQYVHYPHMARHYARYVEHGDGRPAPDILRLLRGQVRPWMLVADFSFERMKSNLTVVNSDWTGRQFKDVYGIDPVTIYPPVPGDFGEIPWDDRENGIICLGRPNPRKRFELAVDVLNRLREVAPDLHLHIVTNKGQLPVERAYYSQIRALVRANSSRVQLHEDLPREELAQLISRQRYGFHAQIDEHFGIAPAELVRAGCITFVHDSGGQVEIVGKDSRLVWSTAEEAADKIRGVVNDRRQQADLQEYLSGRKELFTVETFAAAIRQAARNVAAPRGTVNGQTIPTTNTKFAERQTTASGEQSIGERRESVHGAS
jgi:glycosyltransferase involved in cell wall biosynthesis